MVDARVRAAVQPTETHARVEAAVRGVFPEAELARTPWGVEGLAGGLARFEQMVREQRIPDTARGVLLRHQDGGRTWFELSKQAAAAGKLNFAARPGPLGDIRVEVEGADAADLQAWIDRVAPDTRGWTLEARGLTEKGLRSQESWERTLDALEAGEGGPGER